MVFFVGFILCWSVITIASSSKFLGESNFSSSIASSDINVVMFYAQWCSYSKKFSPTYERVLETVNNDNTYVPFWKVDCVENKNLYWKEDIEGFPTIKIYINGQSIKYSGDLEYESFLMWVRKMIAPSVINIDDLSSPDFFFTTYLTPLSPVMILHERIDESNEISPLMHKIDFACKNQSVLTCGYTSSQKTAESLKLISPNSDESSVVAVMRSFKDEERLIFATSSLLDDSVTNMQSWLQKSSYPSIVELKESNSPLLFSRRNGFQTHIILLLGSDDNGKLILKALREIAKQDDVWGRCVFVHIDPLDQEEYVSSIVDGIKLSRSSAPTSMIVQSMTDKVQFYNFPKNTDFHLESFEHWIHQFFLGNIAPSRISSQEKE